MTQTETIQASDIGWNEEARTKILDDADRALRDAVVDLAGSMQGQSWEQVYEELFARLKDQFVDFKPGPDLRTYSEAVADGRVQTEG